MAISRKLYWERKSKNLCTICGKSAKINKSLCLEHANKVLEKQRTTAKERIEQGLCSMCGKCPPADKKQRCKQCLEAKKLDSKTNRAPLIQQRIKDGLCTSCGQSKTTSNKLCDKCSRKYNTSARFKDQQRKINKLCTKCGNNPPEDNRRKCLACLEIDKKWRNKPDIIKKQKEKRQVLKRKVMDTYGGKCRCCGIKEITFLNIDHINGNGNKHRKEIKRSSGEAFYKWLVDQNFPDYLQILCYNCNMSKYLNGGTCAHKNKHIGV